MVATEDITVYKYVQKRYGEKRITPEFFYKLSSDCRSKEEYNIVKWVSPYTGRTEYVENTVIKDPLFQDTAKKCGYDSEEYKYEVTFGLHSFGSMEDAVGKARMFAYLDLENGIIECVIPKGTKYWKGAEWVNDYCSESLQIKSVVAEFSYDVANAQALMGLESEEESEEE